MVETDILKIKENLRTLKAELGSLVADFNNTNAIKVCGASIIMHNMYDDDDFGPSFPLSEVNLKLSEL